MTIDVLLCSPAAILVDVLLVTAKRVVPIESATHVSP
jgi:hypothetical protein